MNPPKTPSLLRTALGCVVGVLALAGNLALGYKLVFWAAALLPENAPVQMIVLGIGLAVTILAAHLVSFRLSRLVAFHDFNALPDDE